MISLQRVFTRCARLKPAGIATLCGERQWTWQESQNRVARFAAGLNSLGLDDGERVALLGLNSDRYLESFFSIAWAGLTMVPLNIRWAIPENIYALDDSGARVLLFDDAFLPQVEAFRSKVSSLNIYIYFGDGEAPEWALSYEKLIETNAPAIESARCDNDTVGIFYTGGTTGFPKGVEHSHSALWSSALGSTDGVALDRNSIYLHAAPMFHIADFVGSFISLIGGATHAFIPMFDTDATLKAIADFRVTNVMLVPAMIKMLLQHPDIDTADMSSVKTISYGASPMPSELLKVILNKWPQIGLTQAYGQTELAPMVSVLSEDDHRAGGERLKSAGRANLISEVRIVDEQDNDCPLGTAGEIIVRGPHTMKGYWNKPKETAHALRDGWVYTGDAGYFDEDGYIFIVDRVKDMVVTGGENVFTGEVENSLIAHPAVKDVAVIGIPDDEWGEAVHAIVILHEGADVRAQELIEHCHTLIAGYKCPKAITYRQEPLPLTGAGKVLKTELRRPFWAGQERSVN